MNNMIKRLFLLTILCSGAILEASNSKEEISQPSYAEKFSDFVKETISTPARGDTRGLVALVSFVLSGGAAAYATYQTYKRIKEASGELSKFEKGEALNPRLFPRYFIKTMLGLLGLGASGIILYHSWQQLNNFNIYNSSYY